MNGAAPRRGETMSQDVRVPLAAVAAAFLLFVITVALARGGADPFWLLTAWCTAIAILALRSRDTPRTRVAFAMWFAAGPLALLAQGAATLPILMVVVAALLMGAASMLGAPMYVPEIIVTEQDVERLALLLESLPAAHRSRTERLESELSRAQVVPATDVPRDVVTMNSRIVYEEPESGRRAETQLVYPRDSDGATRISVLAPVGMALLGLRAGQSIDWPMPTGRCKRIRVLDVVYQPEASGDFHL
jgi:regulator of nucleoside diphosphate kinase